MKFKVGKEQPENVTFLYLEERGDEVALVAKNDEIEETVLVIDSFGCLLKYYWLSKKLGLRLNKKGQIRTVRSGY